jgi:hypothetical protein
VEADPTPDSEFVDGTNLFPMSDGRRSQFRPTLEARVGKLTLCLETFLSSSRSSALPIFSNMALALLNLAWWLSVRETDVFFFFVGEPSLLPSEKQVNPIRLKWI